MSNLTRAMMMGAAGASEDKTYVDDVFSTYLWNGTGSAQTFNNGIDLAGEGGMVWSKFRSAAEMHEIVDSERGKTGTYYDVIHSNNTNAQNTSYSWGITSFNSNGFSLNGNNRQFNGAGDVGYASWTFRKAPGFFDVVTYTGNQTARTISHSLGSVPGMIIIKCTSDTSYWRVYHRSTGATKALELNSAEIANNETYWNSTSPTSSVFSLSAETAINKTGETYVAYIFAHDDQSFGTDSDEAIIKCGSFTGANHTESLGFEPQWLLVKKTNTSTNANWIIVDNMRGFFPQGTDSIDLHPNTTDDESVTSFHITSDGFYYSSSSATYVYMAIRRPNKPPTAATEVFAVDYGNSSSTIPCWDSGFPVDFAFWTYWDREYAKQALSRLTGTKYLYASGSNAEANDPDLTWDSNLGWGKTWNTNTISWMFKRAPGFMDVVAYTGTGSARTVSHNLEAIPELVIIKARTDAGENWAVYNSFIGNTKGLNLNRDKPAETTHARWNSTSPTSTQFTVDSQNSVNYNTGTYVAYLFASLSGISKVGNYTGTGNDINVDCGFSSGARFVLIKRTDSDADWFLFDTLRGIAVGNDPYLLLNMAAIQVTNTDYIDPLNAGFTVTSSAPAALNTSGGTYIFLAIA